ncbi:MAG: nucleotide exchange factor GrpE [Magnetococcus sp. DMHC-6]
MRRWFGIERFFDFMKKNGNRTTSEINLAEEKPEWNGNGPKNEIDFGQEAQEHFELVGESCSLADDVEDSDSIGYWKQQLELALTRAEKEHQAYVLLMAEMENLRKRTSREVQQSRLFAVEAFSRDLLTVADNMERALAAISKSDDEAFINLGLGVEMVQSELLRIFAKHGLTRILALNTQFDPNFHQAVLHIEEIEGEGGLVVQEMQAGYLLNGRLLRPAMVGVSKRLEKIF